MTFFQTLKSNVESVFPGLGNVSDPFKSRRNNPQYYVEPVSFERYTFGAEEHTEPKHTAPKRVNLGNAMRVELDQQFAAESAKEQK